jgi:nucleoside-diphosphate-sugar epimerase
VPGPVRRERTGAVVAVTGAGSGAGAAVLAHLAASPRVARAIGVDAGPRPDPRAGTAPATPSGSADGSADGTAPGGPSDSASWSAPATFSGSADGTAPATPSGSASGTAPGTTLSGSARGPSSDSTSGTGSGAPAAPAVESETDGGVAVGEWRSVDVLDPGLTGVFAGVDAVAHLAVDLTPDPDREGQRLRNTRAAQTVITAAFAAGVRRVVVVGSALAYGAYADNPVPLLDDAPLRAVPEASAVGDLLEIERIAAASRRSHRGLAVTVLRPAVVLGAGDREPMAALLAAPRLLRIRGADTRWQFCHVADLAAAVELAALAPPGVLDGPANVACEGWLDHDELERVSGRRSLELPERVAVGTAERLYRLGITPAPPSELAYLVHPWVVDSARLRAAGWSPAYGNAEAVVDHLRTAEPAERRRGTPAVVGGAAAGAAVALVGTAALVRRARRRRSG